MFKKWCCFNWWFIAFVLSSTNFPFCAAFSIEISTASLKLLNSATSVNNKLLADVQAHSHAIQKRSSAQDNDESVMTNDVIDTIPVMYVSCQKLLEMFAEVARNYTECIIRHSLPPRVCLDCVQEFLRMEEVYNDIRNSDEQVVLFGKTCYDVMFSSYIISYVEEIFKMLKSDVWDMSKCDSCWSTSSSDPTIPPNMTAHVEMFWSKHISYGECVLNYTHDGRKAHCFNSTNDTLCAGCVSQYGELYKYFWEIFIKSDVEFCWDVEAAMNDTIEEWRTCYKCKIPSVTSRWEQPFIIGLLTVIICVVTVIFYLGSYIQGEIKHRKLKKYSHLRGGRRSTVTFPDEDINDISAASNTDFPGNGGPGYGSVG